MKYGFVIDNRKCIGCHACTIACKSEHDVPLGVNRTWVKYIEKGTFPDAKRFFSVMRCNHCEDAPCVEICPVTALHKRDDGIVDFDNRRCIGCKACTQACPYDSIYMDPNTNTAAKCNFCVHRTDIGLNPACVNVCPEEAIIAGDLDDADSKISQLLKSVEVTVRKPEKNTKPQLFYINAEQESLVPTEPQQSKEFFWNSQSSGVGHFAKQAKDLVDDNNTSPEKVLLPGTGELNEIKKLDNDSEKVESTKLVYDSPSKGVLWGWEVSAYLWTKSISAGLFLVLMLLNIIGSGNVSVSVIKIGQLFSLVFLGLTGALLVADLDKPSRFFYVLLRPQWKSWLVKGAYIILGFSICLLTSIVNNYYDLGQLGVIISYTGIIFATLTAIYTAFLFNQAKGRDFWQSQSLWLHMLVQALLAGISVTIILLFFLDQSFLNNKTIFLFAEGVVAANIIITLIDIFTGHGTEEFKMVVNIITKGRYKNLFIYGGILLGNVIPLVLMFIGGSELFLISGILLLVGLYIIEHIWVKAPQLLPLS